MAAVKAGSVAGSKRSIKDRGRPEEQGGPVAGLAAPGCWRCAQHNPRYRPVPHQCSGGSQAREGNRPPKRLHIGQLAVLAGSSDAKVASRRIYKDESLLGVAKETRGFGKERLTGGAASYRFAPSVCRAMSELPRLTN